MTYRWAPSTTECRYLFKRLYYMSLTQNVKHRSQSRQETARVHCSIKKQNSKYINRIRYISLDLIFRKPVLKAKMPSAETNQHAERGGWVCCHVSGAASTHSSIERPGSITRPSRFPQHDPSSPCRSVRLRKTPEGVVGITLDIITYL